MRAPLLAVLLAAALCWPAQAEPSAELRRQHEEMLYAVTMVRTAGGSGSGIVVEVYARTAGGTGIDTGRLHLTIWGDQ